jgi:hypothetical protein
VPGGCADTLARRSAPSPVDSVDEPGLVELRIGRLASRTVPVVRVGDEALLPLAPLLELAEVRARLLARGRLEATLQPGDVPLVVDLAQDTVRVGGRRLTLAPGSALLTDGEPYLAATVIGELLRTPVVVSWEDLTATIADPSALPIARRVAREEARAALLASGDAPSVEEPTRPLDRPYVDGLVVDYSLSAPAANPVGAGSYSLAVGADVLGGSLEASASGAGAAVQGRQPRPELSWTGVWRGNPWLTQLRIGDAIGTGPRARFARGVALTNAPYFRSSFFGLNDYAGRLAPGWEIEAYRNGQLLAFDSAGALGAYDLALPVQYGENPIDFVAYGPFGEIRRFNRNQLVMSDLLPARRTEYGASAGACGWSAPCAGTGNLDVRYGLTSRWTARAGAEQFWYDTLPAGLHPYVGISGSPTNTLGVQLDGLAGALARGAVSYQPSVDLRVAGEYTTFAGGAPPPIAPRGARSAGALSAFVRPVASASQLLVEGAADRLVTTTGTRTRVRLATSYQAYDVRLQPYARQELELVSGGSAESRSFAGVNAFVFPRASWGRLLGPSSLRATLEARNGTGVTGAGGFVSRPVALGMRLDLGGVWSHGARGPLWSAVLSRDLRTLRSYTMLTDGPGSDASATQVVQGSVVWNGQRRAISFVPGPSVQRAGVTGRVYLDNNANGRYDAGDVPLPGVTVRVGTTAASSDSSGWFHVWDVVPYQPVPVLVDSMTLASPLWVPATPNLSVEPGPNRYVPLDVPIVPGGVVEGRVVRRTAGGVQGIGGARLLLTERRTRVRRVIDAFVDGDFAAIAVRPGEYELRVDDPLLERLDATAEVARFTLAPSADGTTVDGVEIVLEPRRPAPLPSVPLPSVPVPGAADSVDAGADRHRGVAPAPARGPETGAPSPAPRSRRRPTRALPKRAARLPAVRETLPAPRHSPAAPTPSALERALARPRPDAAPADVLEMHEKAVSAPGSKQQAPTASQPL